MVAGMVELIFIFLFIPAFAILMAKRFFGAKGACRLLFLIFGALLVYFLYVYLFIVNDGSQGAIVGLGVIIWVEFGIFTSTLVGWVLSVLIRQRKTKV